MKTLKEIHSEANKYSESKPLQDAFVAGARWALTGKYYKPSELFGNKDILDPIFEGENDTFEDWWKIYNKKRGKKKAKQKWGRLTKEQQTACLMATPLYVASTPDPVYRKDPLTYLNGECWNDEIIQKKDYEQQRNIQRSERAARLIASAYRHG